MYLISLRKYCLPDVSDSKHPDLRTITCHTLADLLRGKYEGIVSKFR